MLNREPMGMKPISSHQRRLAFAPVSVLNREPMGMKRRPKCGRSNAAVVSVLNREPMGMKRRIAA